jgi:hypothetical protein
MSKKSSSVRSSVEGYSRSEYEQQIQEKAKRYNRLEGKKKDRREYEDDDSEVFEFISIL